ncbi:MAG: UDP-2,3-diacylglucosamine diphosphatase [Gammaproteobacteria bacterium]
MRLYLSDLHLEDPGSDCFAAFARLMASESTRADDIYILGDLTEVWVGDDDDGPLAVALKEVLRTTTWHCRVHLMHGNRDFLMGATLARQTGIRLIADPHRLDDGTLLSHGDAFCIDDAPYQQMRALFRSESWHQDVLGRTLAERRELAGNLRAESRRNNANKAENIMDVAEREVARVAEELRACRLIHGHTHRPGHHAASWGNRYVLGAWERCGWVARQAPGDEPELACFSLTPG